MPTESEMFQHYCNEASENFLNASAAFEQGETDAARDFFSLAARAGQLAKNIYRHSAGLDQEDYVNLNLRMED